VTALYALWHVNTETGEKVRYPRESFPAMEKHKAEEAAESSRYGKAVATTRTDKWETQALPESEESAS
jgi:hypothetical protein